MRGKKWETTYARTAGKLRVAASMAATINIADAELPESSRGYNFFLNE